MQEDTRNLLMECNKGCKMGIESMDQLLEYAKDEKLRKVLEEFRNKHEKLEDRSSIMLNELGKDEQSPGVMAKAFSWFSTEMKMMIEDDSSQIAKILMNGCNMGIQSICKFQNEYKEASGESKALAKDLVKTEEELMEKMKEFL